MTHDLGSVALTLVAEGGYREVDDLASLLHRQRTFAVRISW
jgi:hypothetical protein